MSGRFEQLMVGGASARLYVTGDGVRKPAVIVLHPWWGLNEDVVKYADRLPGSGFAAYAPDLVRGRVATTIPDAERLLQEKDDAHADSVALATVDRLVASGLQRIGVVGFSMGAAWAIWYPAQRPSIVATVVYYGTMVGPSLAQSKTPVLAHLAESDPYEPEENVVAFERALRDAGRSIVIHRYPGTGHWFAEPSRDAWRPEAANLAFDRTVAFLREQLAAKPERW